MSNAGVGFDPQRRRVRVRLPDGTEFVRAVRVCLGAKRMYFVHVPNSRHDLHFHAIAVGETSLITCGNEMVVAGTIVGVLPARPSQR